MTAGTLARASLAAVTAVAAAGCSSPPDEGRGSCPEGFTPTESVNDGADPAETREQAVRAELERLDDDASAEAFAAAVVASQPGTSPGTERLVVDTEGHGDVTMILVPMDPDWTVERSTWCDPI